jgi:hypothetical protein
MSFTHENAGDLYSVGGRGETYRSRQKYESLLLRGFFSLVAICQAFRWQLKIQIMHSSYHTEHYRK